MSALEETWDKLGQEFWEGLASTGMEASFACRLLAEALAFGLNEGDFAPAEMTGLIADRFDELHIAKHLGRMQ